MTDGTRQHLTTISDRNKAAFLVASGHEVFFEPCSDGRVNFQFIISPELYELSESYNRNALIPVLTYVSAQRQLTDAIHDYRQRYVARR